MMRLIILVGLGLAGLLFPSSTARAVEDLATTPASYNGTAPTASNITNWATGWTQPSVQPTGFTSTTGWNYVGTVGGNSAVYLGYGWVITAAHVGTGDFTLNGVTYPMVASSAKTIGTADLVLFQVSSAPALPPLPIRTTDPKNNVSPVAILGWGHVDGSRSVTWGYNTVTDVYQPPTVPAVTLTNNGVTYTSEDFFTLTQDGSGNNYQVVEGDSGGAGFIYNSTSKGGELAGINEAVVSNNGAAPFFSALVQLDLYQSQIEAIVAPVADTPALPPWAIGLLASTLVWVGAPIVTRREG